MNIILYSRTGCSNCVLVKKLLTEKSFSFTEFLIDVDIDRDTLITKYPNTKSLPLIVIDGEPLLDYKSLVDYL